MSFFGRAANLVKGGIKSLTRPSDAGAIERAARERALEEELGRGSRPPSATNAPTPAPRPDAEPPIERRPPERDEHGNVKRTL